MEEQDQASSSIINYRNEPLIDNLILQSKQDDYWGGGLNSHNNGLATDSLFDPFNAFSLRDCEKCSARGASECSCKVTDEMQLYCGLCKNPKGTQWYVYSGLICLI